MLTPEKRRALKKVRAKIASGETRFICNALSQVATAHPELNDACTELRQYVTTALGTDISLASWQFRHSHIWKPNKLVVKDRIAWVDWMLEEPVVTTHEEFDLPETPPLLRL